MEGWWVSLGFSGLSLVLGLVLWMWRRDRRRKEEQARDKRRQTMENMVRLGVITPEEARRLWGEDAKESANVLGEGSALPSNSGAEKQAP